jgi:hypothetical protein
VDLPPEAEGAEAEEEPEVEEPMELAPGEEAPPPADPADDGVDGSKGYRLTGRGVKGVMDMKAKNGAVVGSLIVVESDQVFAMTDTGRVVRSRISDVRPTRRATQGVRFMRLDENERIVALARVEETEEEGVEPVAAAEGAEGTEPAPESAE